MSLIIDHEQRKHDILRKTLHLIGERGYRDVTFQQIADECGIARTLLYKYYSNKRKIFDAALLSMVASIGDDFHKTIADKPELSVVDKIRLLTSQAVDLMYTNPPLLQAIIEYLIGLRRCGEPVAKRVRRHTIGLRRLLIDLVRQGIANGELRHVNCQTAAEALYSVIEIATLRITLTESADREQLQQLCELTLDGLRNKP